MGNSMSIRIKESAERIVMRKARTRFLMRTPFFIIIMSPQDLKRGNPGLSRSPLKIMRVSWRRALFFLDKKLFML